MRDYDSWVWSAGCGWGVEFSTAPVWGFDGICTLITVTSKPVTRLISTNVGT